MATWQVHEAKTRFSELLKAVDVEPQVITRHGAEQAVVLSTAEYRSLLDRRTSLRDYLLGGPKFDRIKVERHREPERGVEL